MRIFFEFLKALLIGIVEGITEWLPISSTGHLILLEQLIPFKETSEGFFDMFDVVIQLGAIMAVVVLYWNKIFPFKITKKHAIKVEIDKDIFSLMKFTVQVYSANLAVSDFNFNNKISLLGVSKEGEILSSDYSQLSLSLLDAETADAKDVKYIVNEFSETLVEHFGTKAKKPVSTAWQS